MFKKIDFIKLGAIITAAIFPVISFAAIVNCDGVTVKCDFTAFVAMINEIINWFVVIAGSIAALTMGYAGLLILFNPGNTGKLEDAKKMFGKAVWGIVWLLLSWVVIYTIVKILEALGSQTNAGRFLGSGL